MSCSRSFKEPTCKKGFFQRRGDKPGILLLGDTFCCKERQDRCDWKFGYNTPLLKASKGQMSSVPGCGAPGELQLSLSPTVDPFDVKARGKLQEVRGALDGGWAFYLATGNGARGVAATAQTTGQYAVEGMEETVGAMIAETLKTSGEVVTEAAPAAFGAAAGPIALAFGGLAIGLNEKQIIEMQKNLNTLDLHQSQRDYINCKIADARTNQAVTTLIMAMGVAGIAGAFGTGGLSLAVAGAAGLALAVTNKVRSTVYACKTEGKLMNDWIKRHEEAIVARLEQVDEFVDSEDSKPCRRV